MNDAAGAVARDHVPVLTAYRRRSCWRRPAGHLDPLVPLPAPRSGRRGPDPVAGDVVSAASAIRSPLPLPEITLSRTRRRWSESSCEPDPVAALPRRPPVGSVPMKCRADRVADPGVDPVREADDREPVDVRRRPGHRARRCRPAYAVEADLVGPRAGIASVSPSIVTSSVIVRQCGGRRDDVRRGAPEIPNSILSDGRCRPSPRRTPSPSLARGDVARWRR